MSEASKFFDGLADSLLPSKEEREWVAQYLNEPGPCCPEMTAWCAHMDHETCRQCNGCATCARIDDQDRRFDAQEQREGR